MLAECLVRKYACGAYFNQIAREFARKHAAFVPAEIYRVVPSEHLKVFAARIIAVKSHASVACDAPVHLVMHERPQVLISVRSFFEPVLPVRMSGKHGHVLQMAFAAFVAHRAVVRVVGHEKTDHLGAELARLLVVN